MDKRERIEEEFELESEEIALRDYSYITSVQAAYIPEELRVMLSSLGIKDFEVSEQKFSRETIFRNLRLLRQNSSCSADYNKLSQSILIRKSQAGSE